MNIFDFALDMEKEGEMFYRDLAGKTPDMGLKTIFNMLADDEEKHARVIESMKKNSEKDMVETEILGQASAVFADMKQGKAEIHTGIEQVDLYKKAQELELKSERFYREKAVEATGKALKTIFQKLAEEEKKHDTLLHHIIELVSRPQNWVENAEFFHLEDY